MQALRRNDVDNGQPNRTGTAMKLPSAELASYAVECILLLFVLLVIVEAIVEVVK